MKTLPPIIIEAINDMTKNQPDITRIEARMWMKEDIKRMMSKMNRWTLAKILNDKYGWDLDGGKSGADYGNEIEQ